jgi:hypothetical protein
MPLDAKNENVMEPEEKLDDGPDRENEAST